ncbi:PHP domain-containing protein [Candidatus Endomicrobiellum agilis]|uniref:PHP domain-containing protein n=1 Tax=Candidatus Endomicrobiellum agilis TaxID=3238957 RepID=UPI0035760A6C|nr:PHP domain-containing protein [Endomicrobium sp.]
MNDGNVSDLYVDMHVHTNCSDGAFTPKEAIEYASKMKLAAIGITDHDSVDGIDEALKAASKTGLEVIPGIELSSEIISNSQKNEMHILGYYIDYKSEELKETLTIFKKARYERAEKMLWNLKNNGAELKDDSFVKKAGNKAIGRLHFAKALVEEKLVGSIEEAFRRYLANDKPAYASKHYVSAHDAIKLILNAGGVPVVAHPYYINYNDENIFKLLIKSGLMGIEAWHIKHSENMVKKFLSLAEKFNLVATGGSDCHGPYKEKPPTMGRMRIPYSVVEKLRKIKEKMFKT